MPSGFGKCSCGVTRCMCARCWVATQRGQAVEANLRARPEAPEENAIAAQHCDVVIVDHMQLLRHLRREHAFEVDLHLLVRLDIGQTA